MLLVKMFKGTILLLEYTLYGQLQVSNAEPEQTLSFSAEEEEGVFGVEDHTLVLRETLDYETQSLYNLTIAATDDGVPPAKASLCCLNKKDRIYQHNMPIAYYVYQ